jgi:Acetyltransferase (GNAT) domain
VETESELNKFIESFLEVEAQGWKGTAGGAFASRESHAQYFREVTREAFRRGRGTFLSLTLDGRPIALKHNLHAQDGVFTFKITFDEAYAKFSPGLLLEIENIRDVHRDRRVKWLDSCATPRHPMANRIWGERRMIRRTLISDGSRAGDFVLSALPLLRWMKRLLRPSQAPSYLRISTKQYS